MLGKWFTLKNGWYFKPTQYNEEMKFFTGIMIDLVNKPKIIGFKSYERALVKDMYAEIWTQIKEETIIKKLKKTNIVFMSMIDNLQNLK